MDEGSQRYTCIDMRPVERGERKGGEEERTRIGLRNSGNLFAGCWWKRDRFGTNNGAFEIGSGQPTLQHYKDRPTRRPLHNQCASFHPLTVKKRTQKTVWERKQGVGPHDGYVISSHSRLVHTTPLLTMQKETLNGLDRSMRQACVEQQHTCGIAALRTFGGRHVSLSSLSTLRDNGSRFRLPSFTFFRSVP